MKLTGSLDNQQILEELLDSSKPPVPECCRHLHYLQFTPFRYPARMSTRFRPAGTTQGVFYAAEKPVTAAVEVAFYRLLFFLEAPGLDLPTDALEMSVFSVQLASDRMVDTTKRQWDDQRAALEHPSDYAACHAFAHQAREAGAEIIRYTSVRRAGAANLAVLDCAAFANNRPGTPKGWRFHVKKDRVIATQRFGRDQHEFLVSDFMADTRIQQAVKDGALAA